ncbi:MAG: anti-sigma factor [Chloroflexi bacterium]|nr:anti-sigma factor [Chloroflexota bacterium]
MHENYTALMSLLLDREATAAEERELRTHLATCPACALTWDRWRVLDRRLTNAPLLAPPVGFTDRVLARLHERRQRSTWQKWLGSGLVLLWGVLFCGFWLAVAGLIWWGLRHPLEAALVLSTAAQLVSGVSWVLRSVGTVVSSVGTGTLALGVGLSGCLTGCLALLWVWVVGRSRSWVRAAAPA